MLLVHIQFLSKCIILKRTSCDLILLLIYCFVVKSGHNPVYETIQPSGCDEDTTVKDTQQTSNNPVKSQHRPDNSMVPNK